MRNSLNDIYYRFEILLPENEIEIGYCIMLKMIVINIRKIYHFFFLAYDLIVIYRVVL